MKKLITIGIAALALLVGTAFAGDYHTSSTLVCSECHTMHASQQHGYSPDGTGNFTNIVVGSHGANEYLLRNEVNALCLSCHDGGNGGAPDVRGTGSFAGIERLGGALNDGSTVANGYPAASGHTLGSTATAPGGTFSNAEGLECVDCHTPHGRKFGTPSSNIYRNLNIIVGLSSYPANTPSYMNYAIGTNDLTKDVFERSASFGGQHYDLSNVDYNQPDPTQSAYGKFCGQCHSNFHGTSTAANISDGVNSAGATVFIRHPTAGMRIADSSNWVSNPYRVKTMSASGNWGIEGTKLGAVNYDAQVSCQSCHRAHGTSHEFGLVFPDYVAGTSTYSGSQEIKESGSVGGTYKGLCKQCHRIG